MDCLICYTQQKRLIFLDCSHSMCLQCLLRLQQHVCPFCRNPILNFSQKTYNPRRHIQLIPTVETNRVIRIRRRKPKERGINETFNVDSYNIILEDFKNLKKKHKKRGKNNFRKNNWNIRSARVNTKI